jgi:hypothetical protein
MPRPVHELNSYWAYRFLLDYYHECATLLTMNILKTLLSKIVGAKPAEAATQAPAGNPNEMAHVALQSAPTTAAQVDIAQILTEMAAKSGTPSNWRTSIVDLMKLVGMDSSLAARKELAAELGYTGDTADSATMNIWLHKQVMQKLAENGGKVPAELL